MTAAAERTAVRTTGIVLCGGRSTRMGRPKAWLPWFGRTMVEHVVEQLHPAVDEVVVVTSETLELPPLRARIVRDREPALGPLAGLRDGLEAARGAWAFVTSTDAPFLEPRYVERMLAHGRACAPIDGEHVQVLSAVYPVSAATRSLAATILRDGPARPLALLEALDFMPLEGDVASPGEADASVRAVAWQGCNTPEAYLSCVRRIEPGARAQLELLGRAAARARSESQPALRALPVGTLGEMLGRLPAHWGLVDGAAIAKPYLACLGGRDLVRRLDLPVGPGERVSLIDAMAGG